MGYDIHITRKENWFDDDQSSLNITLEEWLNYVEKDPDLALSNASPTPGFCEWLKHPTNELPWFDYSDGVISTKNPDDPTVGKMLEISKILSAKVQGDDCELYELTLDNKISYRHSTTNDKSAFENKKPWWKFWQ